MNFPVQAELIGEAGPECLGIDSAPGAADGQDFLPEFAAQSEADLADEPLPALDDLQCARVSLAQGFIVDPIAYWYPGGTHVLEPVAAGVLVLQVVQQFMQEPGVRRIADALVPDQHLGLVGDLRP